MEIQELPNEVAHHICGFLGKPELLAMSLSCKHMSLVTKPSLYAQFIQTEGAATPLLLRTLLQNPHLGHLFKSIQIYMYDDGMDDEDGDSKFNDAYLTENCRNGIQKHLQEYFSGYEQEPGSPITSAQWFEDIERIRFNQQHLNAFLILLLPRLESILFKGYYQHNRYLFDVFSRASRIQLGDNPTGPYSLSKLQELSFIARFESPLSTPMDRIWSLMELKSLRLLLFDGLCPGKVALSPAQKCTEMYIPQLRHLTLRHCDFAMSKFDAILPKFKHLKYFHITRSQPTHHIFRLTELISLLLNSSETLTEIKIIGFRRDRTDMRKFPSFQHFPKLRSLTLACDLLSHVEINPHPDYGGVIPRYIRFNEALPASIEYLKITGADRLSPMVQLKCNVKRLSAVPLLKMIVVEFTHTEEKFVEGHEGWKYLTRTFEKSGLRLELFTSEGRTGPTEHFLENRLVGDEWFLCMNGEVLLL